MQQQEKRQPHPGQTAWIEWQLLAFVIHDLVGFGGNRLLLVVFLSEIKTVQIVFNKHRRQIKVIPVSIVAQEVRFYIAIIMHHKEHDGLGQSNGKKNGFGSEQLHGRFWFKGKRLHGNARPKP